jgi:hypothetical protein
MATDLVIGFRTYLPSTFGLFSNFQTTALDDYHIKPPRHEEIEHLQWFRVIGC